MKHLELAAAVVSLAILISCSSIPPPPTGPGTVSAVTVGYGTLASCLPEAVVDRKAAVMGPVGSQQRLKLAIQLPLRNQAELTQLLRDLYDPASANFHKYVSVSAFTERFGATAADYNKVVAWAKAKGFTVIATTPNRRLVAVEGSVDTVNRAFQVKVNNYRHPTEGRAFYSPDREPVAVGLTVPLLQITGMTNYVLPHPMLLHGAAANLIGSGPSREYLPSDMRAAYYGKGPLTGKGQSIGILSFDGYLARDVRLYYSKTGMVSTVPIKNVLVGGFSGACTTVGSTASSTCDDGEQVLDIVNAIGMAPGIKQIFFYEGSNDTQILNQMATDNVAKVLSSSWGWNPADAASDDPIFREFAAQGQSFVSASGDSGEFNSSTYFFPAVDPYVTQVGWHRFDDDGSGRGMVSRNRVAAKRRWLCQRHVDSELAATHGRNQFGEPGLDNLAQLSRCGGGSEFRQSHRNQWQLRDPLRGHELCRATLGRFLALVNQQSVANGRGTVGFINPALYNLGISSSRSAAFHDITSGSNPPTAGDGSGFGAVPGYDLVTGWGSPAGAGLINLLAGPSAK